MPSYRFGPYRLDTAERVLTRSGRPVALTRRMYETLAALVERGGRVVEKGDLMRSVWADAFVEEGNLTQVVFRLRRALGGKYIETVPRRGYRFAAPVREEREEREGDDARRDGRDAAAANGYPVAVLPIASAGARPVPEEIADGITETIISALSRHPRLRVMALGTVFRYKGRAVDPLEVGQTLGVRAVLVGKLRQARDQLVVGAELIDVASGQLLWGGRVARPLDDAVEAQDAITAEIISHARAALGATDDDGGAAAHTESREARRLYLSGRHVWNKRRPQDLKKAINFFRRALDEDPSYAPAYAGLADCYHTLAGLGQLPPHEGYPKAKAAALRALEFDDELAEAHASLGHVHMRYDWDFEAAEREYLRAIELNPSYATARHWLAIYMTVTGRHEEAIAEAERARLLDPLSPIINLYQGAHLYFAGRYEESLAHLRRVLEAEPDLAVAHCFTGQLLAHFGRHDEALEAALTAHGLTNGSAATLTILTYFHALAGRHGEARAGLAELATRSAADEYVNPHELAMIHVALGDTSTALDYLERAYRERVGDIIFLRVMPEFAPLRRHTRFRRLLARLNLPKR